MLIPNLGKRLRIRRLIDPETGSFLMVPMDHGYSIGPATGLIDLNSTVKKVFEGGASAVIVHKGMLRTVASALPSSKGVMIHVSGSTSLSPLAHKKIMTGSVNEIVTMGADGISAHINLGADDDYEMLGDLANISENAYTYGMPLLAMMYVRNSQGLETNTPDAIAHAARVAEELGCDIVKVNATANGDKFDEVTQGIRIPVIIAGGSKKGDFKGFLKTIENCILHGAAGVSIGRNVFQADDPATAMKKIKETVLHAISEVGELDLLS